jgi:hypothetical protein
MRIERKKILDLGPMGKVRVLPLSRRIFLVSRQLEEKGRTASPVVPSLHGPAMGLDDRLADGKPHAQTLGLGRVKKLEKSVNRCSPVPVSPSVTKALAVRLPAIQVPAIILR